MLLREAMMRQGNWLFRRRSYLPLLLLPAAFPALLESGYVEHVVGHDLKDHWEVICVAIAFVGLCVRAMTIGAAAPGTSGRNTSGQKADSLNTTGIYSIVRNPLYLGNYVMLIGLVLMIGSWWFVFLVSALFVIYYERIIYAEEAYLEAKFGDEYRAWASRTPVFVPNPRRWVPSDRPFLWRKVLRHEYTGLYVIVVFSTLIDMLCDLIGDHESVAYWWSHDQAWIAYFVMGTLVYLTLRAMKKHSRLLDLPKRPAAA